MADAVEFLPDPDFTCTPPDCTFVAGIRPYRPKTFRLETQTLGTQPAEQKYVVHNYGHGGAGITMSWGCAVEVRDLVQHHTGATHPAVAVLGAGVMGLTAAKLLVGAGYPVAIYAAALQGTTSDVAGGQWCPSFVEHEGTDEARRRFVRILRNSFEMYRCLGADYGVSKRINYSRYPRSQTSFQKVPIDVIPEPTEYARLPFAHMSRKGYGYHTLLVEPPIFLGKLRSELAGVVPFTQRKFATRSDILRLTEPVVINCTGLGSKDLFGDTDFLPIKGQLVLLKAQPNLNYLYSSDETYVFPRKDHVVVGGSYEKNPSNPDVSPEKCRMILKMAKDVFAGQALQVPREAWMLPRYR